MRTIAWFEFRAKMKRLSTYVYFVVFTVLAAMWMAAAAGAFQSANIIFSSDKVFVNAPYALAQTITVLGLLGVVVVAAFMGRAVQQDFEYQTFHFFFTSPISKREYLLGRYFGAVITLFFIFGGIALGVLIGANWPGVDPTRIGPWSLMAFVQPYLIMLLPNILFLGAIFFSLAALARRMLPVYIAGVVVLIGYIVAIRLLRDIDNRALAALIDPIGSTALGLVTRYWSPAEKNTQMIPLANEILWNRALWLAVGGAIFAFAYARFKLAFAQPERKSKPKAIEDVEHRPVAVPLPIATLDTSAGAYLKQLPGLVRLYLRETVKNVYFGVIVLTGALFVFANAKVVGSQYGTNTYPVTYQVLDFAAGSFALFTLIITAFYAGELVWRERDARMAQIADSLPQPTWLSFLAKLLTLMGVQAVLQVVVMVCGVLIQLFNGYTRFELGQYLFSLFVLQLPVYWMIAALALMVHSVVNHKYLGHFIVILYYVAEAIADGFGYDHRLYRFANTPSVTYSDMNRYGHFLGPVFWFMLYWAAASVLLLVAARLFWVRGTDTGGKVRLRIARALDPAPGGDHDRCHAGLRRVRRVHLSQHQRPQSVPQRVRPRGPAGAVREGIQVVRHQAAAQGDRLARERGHLPVRAPHPLQRYVHPQEQGRQPGHRAVCGSAGDGEDQQARGGHSDEARRFATRPRMAALHARASARTRRDDDFHLRPGVSARGLLQLRRECAGGGQRHLCE